jgi:hypothetical protein
VDAHERRLRRQTRTNYESGFLPASQAESVKDEDVDVDVDDLSLDSPRSPGYAGKVQISQVSSNFGLDQVAVEFAASRNAENNTSVPDLPHSNYLDSVDFVNACKGDLVM